MLAALPALDAGAAAWMVPPGAAGAVSRRPSAPVFQIDRQTIGILGFPGRIFLETKCRHTVIDGEMIRRTPEHIFGCAWYERPTCFALTHTFKCRLHAKSVIPFDRSKIL